ncbi:recyclin-1, partial [Tremellales sp. Uapishka_1]
MDKWAPIAPSKPGGPSGSSVFSSTRFASVLKPSKPLTGTAYSVGPRIGRWPESILLRVVQFLPIPDLPNVARANRAFSRIVRDEQGWEARCRILGVQPDDVAPRSDGTHKSLHTPKKPSVSVSIRSPAVQQDDDFGDFSQQPNDVFEDVDFGDFEGHKSNGIPGAYNLKPVEKSLLDFDIPLPSRPGTNARSSGFFALTPAPAKSNGGYTSRSTPGPFYLAYKKHHTDLLPLCMHLRSSPSPSSTLSLLFPPSPTTSLPPSLTAQSALLLSLLLFLSSKLQPLHDWGFLRQALLLAADRFDSSCLVAFEVADSKKDEPGMSAAAESSWKVWEAGGGRRDEWECGRVWVEKREVFYEKGKWDATENIIKAQSPTGATVRQLDFTPMDAFISHVLETFRIDAELAVRVFPAEARVVLSFCERVASDVPLLTQARAISQDLFLRATAATFVQAWKLVDVVMEVVNMDEYLDDETEAVKASLEAICRTWEQTLGTPLATGSKQSSAPTFLNASNPDQVKRNVLAGFRDVLLLPVTIVPRTVTFGVNAIVTGGTSAVNGLAMLNPQKWAGANGRQVIKSEKEGEEVVLDVPVIMEPEPEDEVSEKDPISQTPLETRSNTPNPNASSTDTKSFDRLQLLVSLDIALELIHSDRESLKRAETFANYPGKYGHKVRETLEEIFILMLKATSDRHIAPGFRIATNQMSTYKPAEHEETTSVAPLLQFFELVHVGDTIQSMVQVYFDKELAQYVDKTDFLNAVMREKKRFEAVLDDAVAAGLNAGIEVLMNQVEHIIQVKTGPREYYPEKGVPMDLGPTKGCQEAIRCLEMHCNLLRGSTSKEVLEVFYQEVGIRLQAILQRHLKRQIISLEGGFQIIADLNAYHSFVASLKQQRITDDFSNLKMLGHVYIVEDAKDLAQIVRDVTRYGGTFRPEDIYEFIQRRSDWKKIEKTVDKAMYALSVKEDCVIM